MSTPPADAFAIRNVRLFVHFRILFLTRFYYPIFTILFLDYGLTIEQFSILNVLWAVTIVAAEVPSGALADLVGRRRLVIAASLLMIVEMATIAFVPLGNATLVFIAFAVNRVCSGLANASASGADEALAYDSLAAEGDAGEWPRVLERMGRLSSLSFFAAMLTGAFLYDPEAVNGVAGWLGFDPGFTQTQLMRVPVVLTLILACFAFITAIRMREVGAAPEGFSLGAIGASFRQIRAAFRWTLSARFVLFVILGGLIFDSVARQFVILVSEYYRQIDIPTVLFGPIGAALSLLGLVTSTLGRRMAERLSPLRNLLLLSVLLGAGLAGLALAIPWWGVLFVPCVFATMSLVAFLQSHYLNAHTPSDKRATVLSLKGLALNLGMGVASLLYTALVAQLKHASPETDPERLAATTFVDALAWFPPYFGVLLVLLLVAGRLAIRDRGRCVKPS